MRALRATGAFVIVGLALGFNGSAFAEEPPAADSAVPSSSAAPSAAGEPSPEEIKAKMKAFEDSLGFRSGKVSLAKGAAELTLPESFRYVGPEGANKVLQAWGNPPDPETEGMIFTKELGPFDDDSWAVVIGYSDDGHVSDEDAKDIDFGELLTEMQKASDEGSEARKAQGLETMKLLGWAEPPHYDGSAHKVYWAKDLQFGTAEERTLNYAIRVLGRQGVLELNAVASIKQLGLVKQRMREVLGFAEFTAGNRYGDYNESTDKLATYGIGALVAGGVAAKTGLFKGLIALLLASKKLLVVGAVAVFVGAKALLKRKPPATETT